MSAPRSRLALWGAAPLLAAVLAGGAAAQQRLLVASEPGTTVVATEVLLTTGPADEEEGEAGLAYLAARTVTAPVMATLDSLGARLAVTAHKDGLAFTLIAAPDAWPEASRTLLVALFRDPPAARWMLQEQRAIRAELAGRQANPADAMLRRADAAVFGESHPWGRSTVGSAESIQRLKVEDVDRFLRANVVPTRAVVAVVGPVDPEDAREHLSSYLDPGAPLVARRPPPPEPAESPVRSDYNSITTWVTVSYLFPDGADLEAVRFLAQLAADQLSFSPSRRSVFNVRSEVIPRLGGGELRFQLVTPPEEAEQWAERVREVVTEVALRPMQAELFDARLRRYRGERLQALAAPEDRARELARRLLVEEGEVRAELTLGDMTLERLRSAGRALRAPTVIFLGPLQSAG